MIEFATQTSQGVSPAERVAKDREAGWSTGGIRARCFSSVLRADLPLLQMTRVAKQPVVSSLYCDEPKKCDAFFNGSSILGRRCI